jgi:hypothetical protein
MWPPKESDNQKWYFDGNETIRSALGFVLHVEDGSNDKSPTLVAMPKNGKDNQRFTINRVRE